eukprot:3723258-Prymnesium_polylepis.1
MVVCLNGLVPCVWRSPVACRYFNKYTTVRLPAACETTLCVEGATYPFGTDEGRQATKYGGDGATTGYVPPTDPLSAEYDPN